MRIKKKLISFIIVFSLLITCLPGVAEAVGTAKLVLKEDTISAVVADTFTIPVSIQNNPGIMGMDINVEYDRELVNAVEVIPGSLLENETVNDSIETSSSNSFNIKWAGSENITDDGVLFNVKFRLINPSETGYTNIKFTVNSDDTYNDKYEDISITGTTLRVDTPTVEKEQLSLAVFMDDWTYGDTPSVPDLQGNTGGANVKYEYSDSLLGNYSSDLPTEVGKYYLKATVEETDEYYGGVTTTTFEILKKAEEIINKKQLTLSVIMNDWTEGDIASTPVLNGNLGNGKVKYEYDSDINGTYSEAKPTEVGKYYLKVSVEETEEYYGGITTCTFNILKKDEEVLNKKPLTLSVIMDDWTVGDTASTPVLSGNIGNGNVTYEYASEVDGPYSETKPTEVGRYYLKVSVEETEEYYAGITTCSFSILKKEDSVKPTVIPSVKPSTEPSIKPSANPSAKPATISSVQPVNIDKSNGIIRINIKNKKTYKKSKVVIIKATKKIKTFKINGKSIKIKKNAKKIKFRLSKYNKLLRKSSRFNRITIVDNDGNKKSVKFKIR